MKILRVGFAADAKNNSGYEAIYRAISEPEFLELCTPVIFGSLQALQRAKSNYWTEQPVQINEVRHINEILDGKINIINNIDNEEEALKAALDAYMHNHIDTIVATATEVTNSYEEQNLNKLCANAVGAELSDVFCWEINNGIKPIRTLNLKSLCDIDCIVKTMRRDWKFIKPRICVVSADEALHETIKNYRDNGAVVFGPFNTVDIADIHYDGVLFVNNQKACEEVFANLEQEHTYGYISGLPVVLTYTLSEATPQTILEAIFAGIDIHRARIAYRHATSSPLEKQWIPRGRDDYKLDLTKESDE